jgi:hypothetical protein
LRDRENCQAVTNKPIAAPPLLTICAYTLRPT